jgi:hypothetical protein
MKKVLGSFSFGFDLEEVEVVMDYIKKNYKGDDYEMFIGRGDDVMNGLDIFSEKMMNDEKLFDFIDMCDGGGGFDEMYEELGSEEDMDDES